MFSLLIRSYKPLVFLLLALILASCNISRRVERRGGYLLTANIVKTDRPGISKDDLLNFAQPKPNKKFLGLLHGRIWVWDAFSHNTSSRFNRWMVRTLGEPPVLLDTVMAYNSLVPMRQYLANKGYFKSDVQSSVILKRGKAKVVYSTITDEPYRIGSIIREISDDTLRRVVMSTNSLLRQGDQYDAYQMTAERDRLTQLLRNSGYYAFNSNYIYFEVDTIGRSREANVKIIISNFRQNNDSLEMPHKKYVFNKIFVHSDYPRANDTLRKFDTISYYIDHKIPEGDSLTATISKPPDFYQIYRENLRLRPLALSRVLFVKPGDYYSQRNVNLTYNRVQNLGLSSYVSVNVLAAEDTSAKVPSNIGLLDCEVRIVRAPVNGFTIEAEGTNAGGLMGLGSSVNYRNRNIFVGAENLHFKLFGAFEIKPSIIDEPTPAHLGIFNSLEAGFEAGIDFPTLLSPFSIETQDVNSRPKTILGLGFNYGVRSEYERYLSKLSLSYEWNASLTSRHYFSPVDLSSISIVRDSLFTVKLLELNDRRFFNQYTNHLILAMKYSYVFNNQNLGDRKNFTYLRVNVEPAGNFFNLISSVTGSPRDSDGKYTLFNIRYAQYFRTDIDFRYYRPLTPHQRMVYRLAFGIGVPYGNSTSLPFEKGFFAGGANGMRGWPVRTLGPGEFESHSANILESVGDMWIEGNVEYRFPMYRYLNGALFTDVGNVWLLNDNIDFPGGMFTWNRALKSLALDAGLGLRFDFSIFVFRIDGALRLYDPARETNHRVIDLSKFQLKDINWNFGIGYPF